MIISASRRTDIPAFYPLWFMNRLREGYCRVPNPFNPKQVTQISLRPEDVDVIVFWTRNPSPLFPYLAEIERRGYRYYFLYTVMNNPRPIDPFSPSINTAVDTFRRLSERIGGQRVFWRYDPILLSTATGIDFHREQYGRIAGALKGCTVRSVISIATFYRKLRGRLAGLGERGIQVREPEEEELKDLMPFLARTAEENGMSIFSCAQERDLGSYGIPAGRCVDGEHIRKVFGMEVSLKKDPSQRKACGCVESRDIGIYDTCLFGCVYCYATTSLEKARANHATHDPDCPSLIPSSQGLESQ